MILRLDDALVATRPLADEVPDADLAPAERGLCDGEQAAIRRQERRAGRAAARDALRAAGLEAPPAVLADDRGRPRLDPPGEWFVSLAHDGALAAAAVGRRPVGVDVVPLERAPQVERVVEGRLRSGRAAPLGAESLRPWPEPLLLWTAWEALGKRSGEGVLAAMHAPLAVADADGVPTAQTAEARLRWFEVAGHLLCLAGSPEVG